MENRKHARSYFQKAQEYLDSAQDNLDLEGATLGAGNAIHAGISAKDAIVTALTCGTSKAKDHAKAAKELRQALGAHGDATTAEKSFRELISMKAMSSTAPCSSLSPRRSLLSGAQRCSSTWRGST